VKKAGTGSWRTTISPFALRQATAKWLAPRIITPSMTAWPP
jgi:hypothetical protein